MRYMSVAESMSVPPESPDPEDQRRAIFRHSRRPFHNTLEYARQVRADEEAEWAAKCGPVTVRRVDVKR